MKVSHSLFEYCTDAACKTTDNCELQIPFTGRHFWIIEDARLTLTQIGSGVTIYVLQAGLQGISVNVAVDGNSPTMSTLDPAPAPYFYQSNVSIYDIQSLPSTTHSLTLTVLTWSDTFSGMMLDYLVVNETVVSPSPSASTLPATSSVGTSPTTSATSPPTHASSSQ